MGNEQLHDPLLQAARNSLKDHEEPFDGSDWARMENSLNALPKTSTFKWSYALNTVIVLAGVAGLVWGGIALSGNANNIAAPVVTVSKKALPVAVTNLPAVKTENKPQQTTENTTVSAPVSLSATQPNDIVVVPEKKSSPVTIGKKKNTEPAILVANQVQPVNPADKTNPENKSFTDLVFGDQLDPRKGPVLETHETAEELGTVPTVDPSKLTYFDFLNGQSLPIKIKGDTSKKTGPPKNEESRENSNRNPNGVRPIR
mgnify:CR=1 FL=1